MKFLFDFFPILLFFIAYKWGNNDMYIATKTAIVASFVQVIWSRYQKGYFEKMYVFTLLTVVVCGGLTLLFRNELFFKWKPTVIYFALALGFLLSQYLGEKKSLIQRMTEKHIQLSAHRWFHLNISWVVFFVFLGLLNIYVAYHFDTNTWVNFKLFGTMGLTFLFIIGQAIYMMRYQLHAGQAEEQKTER